MSYLKTKNYSLFVQHAFNRDVTKTKKLEASMKAHGFIGAYPLHVEKLRGKLVIKGGHHRFEVAQKLGLEIPYVICDDKASIHELEEATNNWNSKDYLLSFCRLGDPDYLAVKAFSEESGILITQSVNLLGGQLASSGNFTKQFKRGEYSVSSNIIYANQVADIIKTIRSVHKWGNTSSCVNSISRIIKAGEANFELFHKKIKSNINSLENKVTVDKFLYMWEEIYNKKSRGEKIPLVFLTNEAIRKSAEENLFLFKNGRK